MSDKPLAGSERQPLPGARAIGKANPQERIEVTVLLRRRSRAEFKHRVAAAAAGDVSRRVTHDEFDTKFGAEPDDIAAVRAFAASHGLAVAHEARERRTVMLSGTVAAFSEAFSVELNTFEHDKGTYRGRTGAIQLPANLHGIVEGVLGLDDRPQAKPHFRVHGRGHQTSRASSAAGTSFTPTQLAALYNYPPGTGEGQTIALIELGGGYRAAELRSYFATLGVTAPQLHAVSVDHAKNHPSTNPDGPDGEVFLDIEVAGSIAPGATIVVYFAPNTDAGFLDAITTAIHDTTYKPSVISISWGGPESSWTQQSLTAFDEAFQAASTLGITVCVAVGDSGSSDGVSDGLNHVDFPASSPYALACGGTSLQAAGTTISSEAVWNDGASGGATGGGVSSFFALPQWQAGLDTTAGTTRTALAKRGVPDVAGDADPQTGYNVEVDGSALVFGGTSAVAPLWSALVARINGTLSQPVGYINPTLYASPTALNDITQGNNGAFSAAVGWDACTGLGSPNGAAVAALFEDQTAVARAQSVRGESHRVEEKEHARTRESAPTR